MTHMLRPAMGLSVALLALLATSCADNDPAGTGPGAGDGGDDSRFGALTGSTFYSTDIAQADEPFSLVDNSRISLQFNSDGISADAGCNQLGGDAVITDDVLIVKGGLMMTEMGCDQALMDQDSWLADILTAKPTVSHAGDKLTVTSGDVVITMLDKETADPDQPLVGTLWTLTGIGTGSGDDGSVGSVPADVTSTLQIGDDGRVSVAPGCNNGGGDATYTDSVVTFGPIALTRMACPGAPMDVEKSVLAVLDGDVDYAIDAGSLILTNGENSLMYSATS